jgi:hypothetical protein
MADEGYVISIEATALTLEFIQEIDPSWILRLKSQIQEGKIEFIGSGYSQIIAPIVPIQVNLMNLEMGAKIYDQLIGYRPTIYLINEMAFSIDLISIYKQAGIENIIFEWNNFYKYTDGVRGEYSYTPIEISDGHSTINVVWADSIVFQKFQRCVHGELESDEFISYLMRDVLSPIEQFIPVYSSDAEIFNFRPGRYKTENVSQWDEWEKVRMLYSSLGEKAEFVFIRDMLGDISYNKPLIEFKPKFPVQVKKQEKYNILRWAIGGRDNLRLNADCYKIYEHLIKTPAPNDGAWIALLLFWSSDFRTHISIPRFNEMNTTINAVLREIKSVKQGSSKKKQKVPVVTTTEKIIQVESESYVLRLNRKKGLVIESFERLYPNCKRVIGCIAHGTYDDITFSNDYMSGYAVCYDSTRKQHTHLFDRNETIRILDDRIIIEAENNCNEMFVIHDVMTATAEYFEIDRTIRILDETIDIIHPFIFTFLPEEALREFTYDVRCGSGVHYNYAIHNWALAQQHSKYLSISSIHGFAPTDGRLVILDSAHVPQLYFEIDNTCSPLVMNFQYEGNVGVGMEKLPFCWLVMSALEVNDAYKGNQDRNKMIRSKLKFL